LTSDLCFPLGNSLASEIQTPGNYPEENIKHSKHGESLKSRIDKGQLQAPDPLPLKRALSFSYEKGAFGFKTGLKASYKRKNSCVN